VTNADPVDTLPQRKTWWPAPQHQSNGTIARIKMLAGDIVKITKQQATNIHWYLLIFIGREC